MGFVSILFPRGLRRCDAGQFTLYFVLINVFESLFIQMCNLTVKNFFFPDGLLIVILACLQLNKSKFVYQTDSSEKIESDIS